MESNYDYKTLDSHSTDEVKKLWQYCFDDTPSFVEWYFKHYYHPSNTLGAFLKNKEQDSSLQAAIQLIPYTLFLRHSAVPVSYIVGVSTAPHARGGGIGKGLLLSSLEKMRSKGHFLSLLMPFEGSFYYPYDWQFAYFHHKYSLDLEELGLLRGSFGTFEKIDPINHLATLQEIYLQFVSSKHAYVLRNEQNWKHFIQDLDLENGFCYLLKNEGKPVGYVFYSFDKENILIREMAYTTPLAKKAFFDFFYKHRSHKKRLEWAAPVDDLTYSQLGTSKTSTSLYPFLTARIVDVVGLLSSLRYTKDLPRISLKIKDTLAPWNDGIFTFEITKGHAKITPSNEESYDFAFSIGAFTQLVLGFMDLSTLANEALVDINCQSLAKIPLLDKIFPKMLNYINEYY